jgi:hypothetical protein
MDSNAFRAGEVERKVWRENDFLLPGKLLKMSPLVDGQSAVSTLRKWGQRRRVATGIRAIAVLLLALDQLLLRNSCALGLMFRRRSGIPSNIRGIERFVWGLYSAPIHSLQFPVLGLCPFGTAWQGNSSSAAEGRPAVLTR